MTPIPPRVLLPKTDFHALLQARHASPHAVLGMHPHTKGRSAGVVVRALLRQAVIEGRVKPDTPIRAGRRTSWNPAITEPDLFMMSPSGDASADTLPDTEYDSRTIPPPLPSQATGRWLKR